MVKSIILPDKVVYPETIAMDKEDVDYASSSYEYTIYGKPLEIVLGKEKYTYSTHDIIYFPIYLPIFSGIDDNIAKIIRIGVFEINSNQLIHVLDEDGDVDLNKGNILLFHFVTKSYLEKEPQRQKERQKERHEEKEKDVLVGTPEEDEEEEDEVDLDEDDVLSIKIPPQNKSAQKEAAEKTLEKGIFTIDTSRRFPAKLPEESESDSKKAKDTFIASEQNDWIADFMSNNQYNVIDNEGGGDCLFAVIRDAFEQIGKHTTVTKLRALLATQATEATYEQYRDIYHGIFGEVQEKEKQMKDLKLTGNTLKKRSESLIDKTELSKVMDEAKQVVSQHKQLKDDRDTLRDMVTEFGWMQNVHSIEQFREYIQKSSYWADAWAISALETALNVKIIIMSEENYEEGDLHSVMQCGQISNSDLDKQGSFSPEFYIMTSYTGDHYKLISYKKKQILTFTEIPYDIKVLIACKCMQRNAGPYYIIEEFRHFNSKLGLEDCTELIERLENRDETARRDEFYDPDTVFRFYAHSSANAKAGKGAGETIPNSRIAEFAELNNKKNKNWRKMLDDSWPAPFMLDGHRWLTVDHYVWGSQFKKGFEDFYLTFAMDSESPISKDYELAKIAGSKSGKTKDKVLREKHIKSDANFIREEARNQAVEAKFSQNMDLKHILDSTLNARLDHFVSSGPAEPDMALMSMRGKG